MSVAAQSSRSLSIFLCESSASVKRNSASSKSARDVKGDQLSSAFVAGGSGGVFGEINAPCLSQHRPVEDEKGDNVKEIVCTIQSGVICPPQLSNGDAELRVIPMDGNLMSLLSIRME